MQSSIRATLCGVSSSFFLAAKKRDMSTKRPVCRTHRADIGVAVHRHCSQESERREVVDRQWKRGSRQFSLPPLFAMRLGAGPRGFAMMLTLLMLLGGGVLVAQRERDRHRSMEVCSCIVGHPQLTAGCCPSPRLSSSPFVASDQRDLHSRQLEVEMQQKRNMVGAASGAPLGQMGLEETRDGALCQLGQLGARAAPGFLAWPESGSCFERAVLTVECSTVMAVCPAWR